VGHTRTRLYLQTKWNGSTIQYNIVLYCKLNGMGVLQYCCKNMMKWLCTLKWKHETRCTYSIEVTHQNPLWSMDRKLPVSLWCDSYVIFFKMANKTNWNDNKYQKLSILGHIKLQYQKNINMTTKYPKRYCLTSPKSSNDIVSKMAARPIFARSHISESKHFRPYKYVLLWTLPQNPTNAESCLFEVI